MVDQRSLVAYHEAGHCLVSLFFRVPVRWISIKPRADVKSSSGGHVTGVISHAPLPPSGDLFPEKEAVSDEDQIAPLLSALAWGVERDVPTIRERLEQQVTGLIEQLWFEIIALTNHLLIEKELDEARISEILRPRRRRWEVSEPEPCGDKPEAA
jgi:hypothetical protein